MAVVEIVIIMHKISGIVNMLFIKTRYAIIIDRLKSVSK